MDKELILEILEYIKDREVAIDSEWGLGRVFDEILKDDEVPEIYYKLKAILDKGCD